MADADIASWKRELFAPRRVHVGFVLLLLAAYGCYVVGYIWGAIGLGALGWVLEMASYVVLSLDSSRGESDRPRGGLR